MSVVPISQLARRIPEAGRLRIGQKGAKGQPQAISTWRFTSHDREALTQIAALYGGSVVTWSDPKAADGQFEVITNVSEIRIVLPPDPLGGSPVYEMWGGGGCERRCDGETAQVMRTGPEGPEPTDTPCICSAKGELACRVTTRLNVILPEIRFAGVWRLDTKSMNAAQEIPGMVDMIQAAQSQGMPYATLSIKHRRSVVGGQTKKFLLPVLGTAVSTEELAGGQANLHGIARGDAAGELGQGDPDDEVVDAELVDEVIAQADAERLAELVNTGGKDARDAWLERFGCKPAELHPDRLDEANDFVSDLEVVA